jgi:hypothetical protein
MPNLPISKLPQSSQLTGTELVPIVQNSVTKKTTIREITSPRTLGLGWARYDDTQYTELNKLLIPAGTTSALPNNAGIITDTYMNSDVEFYDKDTQLLQVENLGDVYDVNLYFRSSATNASKAYMEIELDGAATGTLASKMDQYTIFFPKGNDIQHDFSFVIK